MNSEMRLKPLIANLTNTADTSRALSTRSASNVGSRKNETLLVTLALEQSVSFGLYETRGLENGGRRS